MKQLLLLAALLPAVASADPLVVIPAYPDPTNFYHHIHCTGQSLYDLCPTRMVIDYHIDDLQPSKTIHLPRTDTRAQMRKIDPNADYRYNYRIQ
jgi:hypothetical protein